MIWIPAASVDLFEAHLGAGKHVQIVFEDHPGKIITFLKVWHIQSIVMILVDLRYSCQAIYAGEIFYAPIIVCIKCSILTLYYRLFGIRKGLARTCQALIGITIAWGIATLLPAIFQCNPVDVAWDPMKTENRCIELRPYLIGTNVPNVVLDFAILLTPVYVIWKLKLPISKRLLISGIFVLGAWYDGLISRSVVEISAYCS